MPMYTYRFTDEAGGDFEKFQNIRDESLTLEDGRPCERTVSGSKVHTQYGEGSGTEPIEMFSIALDDEQQIAGFRTRNPGTEISSNRRDRNFGVPIAKSRSEKLRILKQEGFVETN